MTNMTGELPRPDLDDPDTWALVSLIHQQWLRRECLQTGIDVRNAIIGDALSSIIGDDENCFIPQAAGFHPKLAGIGKRYLLIRLDFEIGTPEVPDVIRDRLQEVRGQVAGLDWTDEQQYRKARNVWFKKAKKFVEREMTLDADLRQAVRYYMDEVAMRTSTHWQEFLYGKILY